MRRKLRLPGLAAGLLLLALPAWLWAALPREEIYQPGQLKPVDSQLKVALGQLAPDFSLPAVGGGRVSLSQYRGKKNVALSFVPAAWTPVCSEQWPGYNLAREEFEERDTIVLGITNDNLPTLFAWTQAMGGVWFPVLSDFWPHGGVAGQYGLLRGDGTSERALLLIDKAGLLRYIDVHDINQRPDLGVLMAEIDKLR
ncbi:MAG: redoxin domain-containing protein [Desulfarculus sp.]|nr:redoxin domain-containing protein [Desulfarculus sp.]